MKLQTLFILIKIINNSEYPIEHYLTDESKQLYDRIKDVLNCTICLDMPTDPVECLECSATVCRYCLSVNQVDICMLCRQNTCFKPSRKTIGLLDLLKFKCIYNELGCSVESVYTNWHVHIERCKSKSDLLKIIKDQYKDKENYKSAYRREFEEINEDYQKLKEENKQLKSELAIIISEKTQ